MPGHDKKPISPPPYSVVNDREQLEKSRRESKALIDRLRGDREGARDYLVGTGIWQADGTLSKPYRGK